MTTETRRPHHGQATKILTAGLSSSLVLGIVGALAHASSADDAAARARRLAADEAARAEAATAEAAAVPVVLVPVPGLPQTVTPVVPVAVPVAVPAPSSGSSSSPSASTKASG